MSPAPRDGWFWGLGAAALLTAANALWMLADPGRWYADLPAGVPDYGPYNEHFVRDIGCAFLTFAVALGWAAFRPRWRPPLVTVAALFFAAHAVLHVYDTARGFVDAHHWWLDVPGVYLPAVVLAALSWRLLRGAAEPARPS